MRQIWSVKAGKQFVFCLMLILMLAMLAGCGNENKGIIDPNMVEHNPNSSESLLSDDVNRNGEEISTESGTDQKNGASENGTQPSGR